MECQKISSYQRLKNDFDIVRAELIKERTKSQILISALWTIAMMKGPQVVEAPRLALETLDKHEKK